ncbi:hypothetical protein CTA2_11270 [Colletotrichum tanaceti]|uniref:6-phosphogluconate dehydrogenase NADP-binding domain-containing protein n=1 Tax=Colletotrichum tanaceti TaxID=1306861 RepID=A0A4U6XDX5_9PEZI|nr:hypothetical protein CTA2_11270 [Colletotrichum tanaceti]TKW53990.1 hypothetical protein CTA1_8173 [Colletotrichum tanaceti]
MSRGDPLAEIGGTTRPKVQDLVSNTDIIFMSLSDDAAIEATLDAILGATAPLNLTDKIIVDTSTVHSLTKR